MTFNATCLNLIRNGRLVRRAALRAPEPTTRNLLITPLIRDLLDGTHRVAGFPAYHAETMIGRYVHGHMLNVALTYRRRTAPDLERLDDLDEVWSFCIRSPPPGWRLLGRFVERGTLVCLRAYDRHTIGPRSAYVAAAHAVIEDWQQMFDNAEPLRGTEIDHYVGGLFYDLGNPA